MMIGFAILAALSITLAPDGDRDRAGEVRVAVERIRAAGGGTLTLAPGEYHFRSAEKRNWYVSNHDDDLPRDVFLPVEGVTNLTIVSERAELVFHGYGITFGFLDSADVTLKGLAIDYSRSFNSEWRFVRFEDDEPVLETDPKVFPFSTDGGRFRTAGDSLHVEETLAMIFGGDDHEMTCADWFSGACERLSENRVKLKSKIGRWRFTTRPEAADTVFVTRSARRPNPALFACRTERMLLEDCIVRASPGMGFIAQRSGDITIRGSGRAADRTAGAMPRAGSGRVTSMQADATHFSNCRGRIVVENCCFERMCDDAINVHSTCLKIERVTPPNRLLCRYMHRQSVGFEVFLPGEALRFIRARTLEPGAEVRVAKADLKERDLVEIELEGTVPPEYGAGDAVENADWQPEVRFANNIVNRNVSRGVLFTTPGKVVCESNEFSHISGSAIKLSGDSMNWYESGASRETVIRGNRFRNCCRVYCPGVIAIDPEIREPEGQKERYHRNILIEDNLFETHGVCLVWAKSAKGLTIRNNRIVRNDLYRNRNRKPYHFEYSDDVTVDGLPAGSHPDADVGPENTLMLLVSGDWAVARMEGEINDLADAKGVPFYLGNAQGHLSAALRDGRWQVVLLDEEEATDGLLKEIRAVAPHLKVVIQLRRTAADKWKGLRTVSVGSADPVRQAEIVGQSLFPVSGRGK